MNLSYTLLVVYNFSAYKGKKDHKNYKSWKSWSRKGKDLKDEVFSLKYEDMSKSKT